MNNRINLLESTSGFTKVQEITFNMAFYPGSYRKNFFKIGIYQFDNNIKVIYLGLGDANSNDRFYVNGLSSVTGLSGTPQLTNASTMGSSSELFYDNASTNRSYIKFFVNNGDKNIKLYATKSSIKDYSNTMGSYAILSSIGTELFTYSI